MVGAIFLSFIAFCGQRIDNLLLSYLTSKFSYFRQIKYVRIILLALTVCLTPGIRNRQLIPLVRQYIIDFWNNKKSAATVSVSSSTPTYSPVKTTAVVRPSSNPSTHHTLYSTTSYGSNKTKAQ
jgi:hypothetical protein